MKYFNVCHSDPELIHFPYIGFGSMGISEFYGFTDEVEVHKAINKALELDITHFDTADDYGQGKNERFLKSALELANTKVRKKILLASKAGIERDKNTHLVKGLNIDPFYLKEQLHKSLENLNTDYLDIFYIHRLPPNASHESLEKLALFLQEMKQTKLIRSVGLSEPKMEQLRIIHSICKVSFVQSEYSILERFVETRGYLDEYRHLGIHFVAYSPLCRGLLTDFFDVTKLSKDDFRLSLPRFINENYLHNKKIVDDLKNFVIKKNSSLASLALSYLIHKGVTVIPGMRKQRHVIEAVNSITLDLSLTEIEQINKICMSQSIKGSRYAPIIMETFGFE